MTIGERIKTVRKETGLTLEKFGECIGLKKSGLSLVENGRNGASDQTIKSIAREFAVSEAWLRTGEGPMRTIQSDQIVAEVREKLHLSEWGTTALERFLRLPSDDQRELLRILEDLFGPFEGDDKIAEVREKLHLSEWGTTALERFLRLPSDDQRELLRILEDLFGPFEGDDKIEEAARAAGEAAAAAKRAELLDEKRDQDA